MKGSRKVTAVVTRPATAFRNMVSCTHKLVVISLKKRKKERKAEISYGKLRSWAIRSLLSLLNPATELEKSHSVIKLTLIYQIFQSHSN